MQKDLTKIYLEAARRIAEKEEEFSCIAVKRAAGGADKCLEVRLYASVFGFNPLCAASLNNDERVLYLCLMAVCWRDFIQLVDVQWR